MGKYLVTGVVVLFSISAVFAHPQSRIADNDLWRQVKKLKAQGEFTKTTRLLRDFLQQNLATINSEEKTKIEWEIELLSRIRKDYNLAKDKLINSLQERIAGFSQDEFDEWDQEGRFDSRIIDGRKFYMSSSVSNLFFRYPETKKRRVPPQDDSSYEQNLWRHYLRVKEAGESTPGTLVLPQRFKATMTVTVDSNTVPAGQTIRCWLPYPRSYPFQTDIQFLASSPEVQWIDQPQSPIRSVYFEQKAQKSNPTIFTISYLFTVYAVYSKIDPERVLPYNKNNLEYKINTQERPPHVVFTRELRKLAREIVGNETNPYLQAKHIYQWISQNIQYSYAVEYSTISNISTYCFEHRYGDCGQEALLFITLCRMNGIPARWQSGWYIMPGGKTIHDWAEIYFEPYGWIPVDPYMGIYSEQYVQSLDEEQRKALNDFYFGNIDHFRLVANSDHCMKLFPPKEYFRSDDVDFQRGELESDQGNIYFDQFSYQLQIELLDY